MVNAVPMYEEWNCDECGAAGTIRTSSDEACDATYEQAVERHAEVSPNCPRLPRIGERRAAQ